jgi:hypothetical protein
MNRDREIQIIADEICIRVPGAIRSRTDGTLFLETADCRSIATIIVDRIEANRGEASPSS